VTAALLSAEPLDSRQPEQGYGVVPKCAAAKVNSVQFSTFALDILPFVAACSLLIRD
jgi:hypothetical protein